MSEGKTERWVLVDEFESGCKTFVDANSLKNKGNTATAWVKYYLVPPGINKINKKEVREMLFLEEYYCDKKVGRASKLIFNNVDGTSDEVVVGSVWTKVEGNREKVWEYISSGATNKRG